MSLLWVIQVPIIALVATVSSAPLTAQVPQVPQIPQIPGNIQLGTPATPTITAPKGGQTVSSPIVIKGTATKGARVKVTATLAVAVNIPVSGLSTKLGNAEATADDKGAWQVSIAYNIPIKASGTKIVLEAVATNTLTGQASGAAKIEVAPKV
jgi:hypothetical protein